MDFEDDEISWSHRLGEHQRPRQHIERIAGRTIDAKGAVGGRLAQRAAFRIERIDFCVIVGRPAGQRQFVEAAIDAVIHVERFALAQYHLRHQRHPLGDQRATRFAEQRKFVEVRQRRERFADRIEIPVIGRHILPRIGTRKSAADIERDDVDFRKRRASPRDFDRLGVGKRAQALRADMEGQRRRRAGFGDALEQPRAVFGRRAEFARQFEHRAAERRRQPHEDPAVLAALGFGQQLVEFEIAVDDEIADPVARIGDPGRALLPHRRHEMTLRIGKHAAHQFDLGQRGGVEMADAGGVDEFEHRRRRIGLDRKQRVAGKGVEETARRDPEFLREQHIDRLAGLHGLDQLLDAREAGQGRIGRAQIHDKGPGSDPRAV